MQLVNVCMWGGVGVLFLPLTSNPVLPHPHPPLTQHGAAWVGALGFSVSAEEVMSDL